MTEIRSHFQSLIHFKVVGVLMAIVIGDRQAGESGLTSKTPDHGLSDPGGRESSELRDFKKAGFSLKKNMKTRGALPGDRTIGFPMAEFFTGIDLLWTLIDEDPLGNQ